MWIISVVYLLTLVCILHLHRRYENMIACPTLYSADRRLDCVRYQCTLARYPEMFHWIAQTMHPHRQKAMYS
jgi:hypothetical protein